MGATIGRWLLSPVLFTTLLLAWGLGQAADLAGRVEFIEGDVRFVTPTQPPRRPVKGDRLFASDTVATGRDGEVHLQMEDGGYLAVRPNTRLTMVEYRARGDAEDRSLVRLLVGTFRSITGWIPRVAPANYRVQGFTATIGVRGTDHEPFAVEPGGSIEAGLYDKVNIGATFIDHASGRIDILQDQTGYAPPDDKGKAGLLQYVPGIFQATRNEGLLAGRHQAVQDQIDQRLDARRRELNESRPRQEQPKPGPQKQDPAGKGTQPRSQVDTPKSDLSSNLQQGPDPDVGNALGDTPRGQGLSNLPGAPPSSIPGTPPAPPAAAASPSAPPSAAAASTGGGTAATATGAAAAGAKEVATGAASAVSGVSVSPLSLPPVPGVVGAPVIPAPLAPKAAAAAAPAAASVAAPPSARERAGQPATQAKPARLPPSPSPQTQAGRTPGPRGVDSAPAGAAAVPGARPTPAPAAPDRTSTLKDLRQRQLEDHRSRYEINRDVDLARDQDSVRGLERQDARRLREQR